MPRGTATVKITDRAQIADPETKTPGQIAFEAFLDTFRESVGDCVLTTWAKLAPWFKAAWEAAAEAVTPSNQ